MKTLSINPSILSQSIRTAQNVLDKSNHLCGAEASYLYNARFDGFKDLKIDENGHYSFTPFVITDVAPIFKEIMQNIERYDYFNKVDSMNLEYREGEAWKELYWSICNLSNEELIARKVTNDISEYIKEKMNKYESFKKIPRSPKLTKLITFLFGEKAGGAVNFFSNICPREHKAGLVDEYRINVSVLPHTIAGMSYYSSYNHGGGRWNGYNGTSCQDTSRTNDSHLIKHLPASVSTQVMGIAWLSKKENDDIFHPIMEARTLIFLVPCEYKNVFLIANNYHNNPTMKSILFDGLKEEYGETMLVSSDINVWGEETTEIQVDIEDIGYSGTSWCECDRCNGTGEIERRYEVETITITRTYDEYGDIVNEDEETETETEYEEEECYDCNGRGGNEDDDDETYLPYLDETHVMTIEDEEITYFLPTQLLEDIGAINPAFDFENANDPDDILIDVE